MAGILIHTCLSPTVVCAFPVFFVGGGDTTGPGLKLLHFQQSGTARLKLNKPRLGGNVDLHELRTTSPTPALPSHHPQSSKWARLATRQKGMAWWGSQGFAGHQLVCANLIAFVGGSCSSQCDELSLRSEEP